MAKCDALDGLKDGLIDDPRTCSFDAHKDVPACAAGKDGWIVPDGGSGRRCHEDLRGPVSNGKPFFPGFMLGSEGVAPSLFGGGPP